MPRALWVPDVLREFDIEPILVDRWDVRGSEFFDPFGSLDHHTAGARFGYMPSLGILINGREGIPGPLATIGDPRCADGDNRVYVIAAGRANHAGTGGWNGLTGNSRVLGVERENTGTSSEPWTSWRTEKAARIHAALVTGCGAPANNVCRHQEWAPRRKIDTHSVRGVTLRAMVHDLLGSHRPTKEQIMASIPDACPQFAVLWNDDLVITTKQGHIYHFDADGIERGGDDPSYIDAYVNHPHLGGNVRTCLGVYAINRNRKAVANGAPDAVGYCQVFDDGARYHWVR